jgi:putative ABC transport system substrate-binding protein
VLAQARRRQVLIAAGVLLAAPAIHAQAPRGKARVGIVFNSARQDSIDADAGPVMLGFQEGLRALGYIEGQNVLIERRTAEGKLDRLEGLIRGLTDARMDVIVVTGNRAALAAKEVGRVPVVVAGMAAPIELGVASSLSRPGGNITGLVPTFNNELEIKRLELVREILPKAKRVAYFNVKTGWDESHMLRAAAGNMGFSLIFVDARLPNVEQGLAQLEQDRPDALFVPPYSALFVHSKTIAEHAAKLRLPDFHGHLVASSAGALVAYGHDAFDIFRRSAGYVVRILNGAHPGDLPIEQMDQYRLVVNLKAAKTLGVEVPQSILLRADRTIQ